MEFHLPELGEGVYEAEMSRWLIKEGDRVRPGQGLLEVLTDKATMEVPAPFEGTVANFRVKSGQKLKIGDTLLDYRDDSSYVAPTPVGAAADEKVATAPPVANSNADTVKAAPSVRALARKLGLDLARLRGSGPGGRVLLEDVTGSVTVTSQTAPLAEYGKPGTRIKVQGLRRKIAEHMVHAKHTIPHYTYVDELDVSEMVRVRDGLRAASGDKKNKITYLPFVVKAVVQALKEVPLANSSLDDAAGEIVLHNEYHIGFATATPGGLLVPVLHHADRMGILELASEIERLSSAARANQAKREDLMGGTFTITSIGNLGGLFATPIIHVPQVGILCIGKIVKRPVFDAHGQVCAADMVYLSFAFDHRVLDGALGTAFGNAVMKALKNPVALLV